MAVDIEYRLSGGAANSDPAAALGGAMSSVEAVGSTLFDTVTSAGATAGETNYRCVYVTNNGATATTSTVLWVQANTPSATTAFTIALGGEGLNGTAEVVGNESTAPTGESFVAAASLGAGLTIGALAAADKYPVWIKRVVDAGTAGVAADTCTLRVSYDYVP
jgi:hypothetical protein